MQITTTQSDTLPLCSFVVARRQSAKHAYHISLCYLTCFRAGKTATIQKSNFADGTLLLINTYVVDLFIIHM